MKKTAASILIIAILLAAASCSYKDAEGHVYTYEGENKSWTAQYTVHAVSIQTEKNGVSGYEISSEDFFTITYKNDITQLAKVETMEITYVAGKSSGSINYDSMDTPLTEQTYTMRSASKGSSTISENETIEVTITLDGKPQTFELKNTSVN